MTTSDFALKDLSGENFNPQGRLKWFLKKYWMVFKRGCGNTFRAVFDFFEIIYLTLIFFFKD